MIVSRKKKAITSSEIGSALIRRLDNIFEIIFRATGGFQNSDEVATKIFMHVLENSRFLSIPSKRRRVVKALYDRYYRGK